MVGKKEITDFQVIFKPIGEDTLSFFIVSLTHSFPSILLVATCLIKGHDCINIKNNYNVYGKDKIKSEYKSTIRDSTISSIVSLEKHLSIREPLQRDKYLEDSIYIYNPQLIQGFKDLCSSSNPQELELESKAFLCNFMGCTNCKKNITYPIKTQTQQQLRKSKMESQLSGTTKISINWLHKNLGIINSRIKDHILRKIQ